MKKLMFLLGFLATCGTTRAQIPDVTGEWEIRFARQFSTQLLIETNLGQVDRHVHHDQIRLMRDGLYLMKDGCVAPGSSPVLNGDIDDNNVLTLTFINGDQYAFLAAELHMDVDDNQFSGTFTGTVCSESFFEAPFTARRHLPFSGDTFVKR